MSKLENQTPHHLRSHKGEPIPTSPRIFGQEHGQRVMVRCCLPIALSDQVSGADDIIARLQETLIDIAGGFTCYPMLGGWKDTDTGDIMHERGHVYEVSLPTGRKDDIARVRNAFCDAGRNAGEKWIHIELHHFEAAHTQVNE